LEQTAGVKVTADPPREVRSEAIPDEAAHGGGVLDILPVLAEGVDHGPVELVGRVLIRAEGHGRVS